MAAIAGAINAIGLLGFQHQAISHVTGATSALSLSIVNADLTAAAHLLLTLLAFILGAVISGTIVENAVLRLGPRYSWALSVEAGLLLAAMLLLGQGYVSGHYLASAACGLQNGMVSTYSGAIVRTTHMTGLFTDLGTMLGSRLRGHPIDNRRMLIYLLLISGFVLGGIIGGIGFQCWRFHSLLLPILGSLGLSLWCWAYRRRQERMAA